MCGGGQIKESHDRGDLAKSIEFEELRFHVGLRAVIASLKLSGTEEIPILAAFGNESDYSAALSVRQVTLQKKTGLKTETLDGDTKREFCRILLILSKHSSL